MGLSGDKPIWIISHSYAILVRCGCLEELSEMSLLPLREALGIMYSQKHIRCFGLCTALISRVLALISNGKCIA
jgi:hypothetical protein